MKNNPAIILRPGREQSVLRRHPWVFSGAVNMVEGEPVDGHTFDVYDSKTNWLARGSYSSKSQITVRLLTYDQDEVIDESFWDRKIRDAISFRKDLTEIQNNDAYRLIHAESDGLPGIVVDRYGEYLVCQFSSAGAEFWKKVIISKLMEIWPCKGIFERSDSDSRLKEGYPARVITLAGSPPPSLIQIRENSLQFMVDVHKGHKTGFYLDQSVNREKIMAYCKDRYVLNAFSYSGGFGIAAAKAGATLVTNVDSSEEAIQLAKDNFLINNINDGTEYVCEDVFNYLRTCRDSRKQFDVIILDPPKFVASVSQLSGGARGYKDINLLAFKLLKPGGILATFSCSGYVKPDLFQKIVSDAAIDAGRRARILDYLFQSPDHPVSLSFPEGLYLKGLICKVD
jgi:23S rRNA (cytosine1962-C5)-methyltransferase